MDGEAHEATDQCAVDADVLKIPSHRALNAFGHLADIPAADRVRDELHDPVTIAGGRADRGAARTRK